MKKGFYYLSVAVVTVLCAIGGIKLIHSVLSYSSKSEVFVLSTIAAALILSLGWVLGVIFRTKT